MKLLMKYSGPTENSQNSQTMFNLVSTIVLSLVNFVSIPIFTRLLGAEQYGAYAIYLSWLSIFSCFFGLKTQSGLGTGKKRFANDYYGFRSSTLCLGTVISIGMVLVGIILWKVMTGLLRYDAFTYVALLVNAFSIYIIEFVNLAWTYEKRAAQNMAMSIGLTTATVVLSIVMIKAHKASENLFLARAYGTAIPYALVALAVWILIFKKKKTIYNNEYWIYSLNFGVPLVFHNLSQTVLVQSDRIMMNYMGISTTDIGVYSFFYSFVAVLSSLLAALNNSWVPFFYDDLGEKKYEQINRRIKNYVQIITIIICGFILLSREVSEMFASKEYWNGEALIAIFATVVYFTFAYQFSVNYEFFCGKTKIVALGTFIAAAMNIALNGVFIKYYGMFGAAIATALSYFFLALIHAWVVTHWNLPRYPLTYKPLVGGGICIGISIAIFYFLRDYWLLRWSIGGLLGIYECCQIYKRKSVF